MNSYSRRASVVAVLSVSAALTIGCESWPPVVKSVDDVSGVSEHERSIRCLDCTDAVLAAVAQRLDQLDYIFITGSAITDAGVRSLGSLGRLRQISVADGSRLTDSSLEALGEMPALRELYIDDGVRFTNRGLLAVVAQSKLTRVFVSGAAASGPSIERAMRELLPSAAITVSR